MVSVNTKPSVYIDACHASARVGRRSSLRRILIGGKTRSSQLFVEIYIYIDISLEFRAIFLAVFFLTFLSFSSPRFIIPSHFVSRRACRIRKKRYYFRFHFFHSLSFSLSLDEIKIFPAKYTRIHTYPSSRFPLLGAEKCK